MVLANGLSILTQSNMTYGQRRSGEDSEDQIIVLAELQAVSGSQFLINSVP